MPNTAQHEVSAFESLSDAELITATGGFDIGGIVNMASGIAQQAGSPQAADMIGKVGGMAQSIMGMVGGAGGAAQ